MWTKEIKQPTKEIFCDVTCNRIPFWNGIPDDSSTPCEYFTDYLRDNYDITFEQCNDLCEMFKKYYNIEDFYDVPVKLTYTKRYKEIKRKESDFVNSMLDEVVLLFKEKHDEPLKVGNMVYFYCLCDGREVPAYRYMTDEGFLPIYDKDNLGEYGWHDLLQVTTILDVITKTIK